MLKFGVVCLALAALAAVAAADACTNGDYSLKDLNEALKNQPITFSAADGTTTYNWEYLPCSSTGTPCGTVSGAAVCQTKPGTTPTNYGIGAVALVTWNTATYSDTKTFSLTFGNISSREPGAAANRASVITFQCDPKATAAGVMSLNGKSGNTYQFTYTSSAVCVGGSHSSSDGYSQQAICGLYLCGGWIFIVILTGLILIYIFVGVLVKIFVYKARGLEMIPNWRFWKVFPFMLKDGHVFVALKIRDGVMFVVNKIRNLRGQRYENI